MDIPAKTSDLSSSSSSSSALEEVLHYHGPFHHRFNLPCPRLHAVTCNHEDLTKQSFTPECDINVIMKRYQETGILDHVREDAPRYLDSTVYDFQQAMEIIAEAETLFEELPSHVRDRFANDPAKLLEFIHDDRNRAEAVELGLIDPAKATASEPARTALSQGTEAEPGAPGTGIK